MDKTKKETIENAERNYSGVQTDIANDDKVSKKLVDEETKSLNNNPRNNDL